MTRVLAIGDLTVDQIMGRVEALPAWGAETEVASLDVRLGGNTGNFAVAATILGSNVSCAGPVGSDANGRWVLKELERCGIATDHVEVMSGAETSLTVAIVREDGERLFVTYPGVLRFLTDFIRRSEFGAADFVVLSGWCQPPRIKKSDLLSFISKFQAAGSCVVLDLAWSTESWNTKDNLLDVLSAVNIAIMNADEAQAVTGQTDPIAALQSLREAVAAATVVVKCGADGALAQAQMGPVFRTDALKVTAIGSTVGAGDSFNAAFIHALGMGRNLADALRFGCDFASYRLANPEMTAIPPHKVDGLRNSSSRSG